jgi:predicted nucleotidyltransferase component of viral defense system
MEHMSYTPLQLREVFHIEFLRWFTRRIPAQEYVLKGGVNLRLFFKSIRYSEDIDIDVQRVGVASLKKITMDILTSRGFVDSLGSFGIERVLAPDIGKAKQTSTTQRFKVHLMTAAGEDLFTKVEFSRREITGNAVAGPVADLVLRPYRMAPLIVMHYDAPSAVQQKIRAVARRTILQARDIFDLFLLSSQFDPLWRKQASVSKADLAVAMENVLQAEHALFRDSVVAYLGSEDQSVYASSFMWDEIKLKVFRLMEEFKDVAV